MAKDTTGSASFLDQAFDLLKFGIKVKFDSEREESVNIVDPSKQFEAPITGGGAQPAGQINPGLSLGGNNAQLIVLGLIGLAGVVVLSRAL